MTPRFWKLKGTLLRWTCPLFFKRIGKGTMFSGWVRFPLPMRNITVGANCIIGAGVFFQTGRDSAIEVGDNVTLNTGTHVVASDRIRIGAGTAVGEYVSIRDQDHHFSPETGVRGQGFRIAPIDIGANCWIGRGVYIAPGTTLGAGSIVAANSVVKGSFPERVLIAGTPATIKRYINADGSYATQPTSEQS